MARWHFGATKLDRRVAKAVARNASPAAERPARLLTWAADEHVARMDDERERRQTDQHVSSPWLVRPPAAQAVRLPDPGAGAGPGAGGTALFAGWHGKVLVGHHRPHPLARQVEEFLAQIGRVGLFRQPHAILGKLLELLC